MALVLPNEGLTELLDWMIRIPIAGVPDLVFTLWKNDIEPDQDTTLADLERADFGGFQEMVLSRAGWTTPVIDSGRAVTQWGSEPTRWTLDQNPQTVYGWAAYDPDTLALVVAERFDVPRALNVGDTLGVLPRMTLGTYVPCP